MTTLIFDTETTGLPHHPLAKDIVQPLIIEWGGALVDERGAVLDEEDVLINPGRPLEEVITKITGITDDDLKTAPRFNEVAPRLRELFAKADVLVAHNLPFDVGMMKFELLRHDLEAGWPWPPVGICTVQEHAEEWGKFPKLSDLYAHYTGQPLAQKHRALDDVWALMIVCKKAGLLL